MDPSSETPSPAIAVPHTTSVDSSRLNESLSGSYSSVGSGRHFSQPSTPSRPSFVAPPDWTQRTPSKHIEPTFAVTNVGSNLSNVSSASAHSQPQLLTLLPPFAGMSPHMPLQRMPSSPLALSRSGDTLSSPANNNSTNNNNSIILANNPLSSSFDSLGTNHINAASFTESSVLLGLEELERQQADLEKRRAQAAAQVAREAQLREMEKKQSVAIDCQPISDSGVRMTLGASGPRDSRDELSVKGSASRTETVPSQIHLLEDDEDTALTSEGVEKRNHAKDTLTRVTSIEKLRGQMSVSLRKLRTWSLSTVNDNQVGSVDSTQNASLSRTSGVEQEPSPSANNTNSNSAPSIQRYKYTKTVPNRISADSNEEQELNNADVKPLVFGFLHKLGRNGHWQKRFFEMNGECLTYYKSAKKTKLLATLDLCKVGEIAIDPTDPEECTFTIQVSNRPYYLRAQDKAQCNDWVITLNRAREARMKVGNIQLVTANTINSYQRQGEDDYYTPHIVISSLRPRTHGSDLPLDLLASHTEEEHQQIEVFDNWDLPQLQQQPMKASSASAPTHVSMPSPRKQPIAKWQKKHSPMHQLSLRFLKWARSITNRADACRREKDVVVVPAHVLRNMTSQTNTTSSFAPTPIASQQTAPTQSKPPGPSLPVLVEDESSPSMEQHQTEPNRSRTSTDSTAGGFGSSQYV